MTFIDFLLSQSAWAARIERKIDQIGDTIVTTISEALQAWTDYAGGLKQQLSDAEAALSAANDTIQQLKDTDAAEDAAEAAALQDQIAQQISDALAAVQNPPEPPAETPPPPEDQTGELTNPGDEATPPPAATDATQQPADADTGGYTAGADTASSDKPPWASS